MTYNDKEKFATFFVKKDPIPCLLPNLKCNSAYGRGTPWRRLGKRRSGCWWKGPVCSLQEAYGEVWEVLLAQHPAWGRTMASSKVYLLSCDCFPGCNKAPPFCCFLFFLVDEHGNLWLFSAKTCYLCVDFTSSLQCTKENKHFICSETRKCDTHLELARFLQYMWQGQISPAHVWETAGGRDVWDLYMLLLHFETWNLCTAPMWAIDIFDSHTAIIIITFTVSIVHLICFHDLICRLQGNKYFSYNKTFLKFQT